MKFGKKGYFFKRVIGDQDAIGCFSDGSDPFTDFYFVKNRKKIHIRYLHELQYIIDSLQKGSSLQRK
jgi:hypothetical protein